MKRLAPSLAILLLSFSLFAQDRLALTVDTIMRGPGLAGYEPRAVRWARDGQSVYFEWKEHTDPVEKDFDTFVAGRDGKGLRRLTKAEAEQAPRANASFSRDRSRALYVDDGDVYLYDSTTKRRRALTSTTDTESRPRFTRDEKRVAFVRANNLYVLSLDSGMIAQLTNIVGADDKGRHVTVFDEAGKDGTASQKWVAEEAKKLSDVVARRAAKQKEEAEERKREIAVAPLKLKRGESVADLQLTPDEKHVLVFLSVESSEGKRTIVPSYVTESGYTTDIPARLKVGDPTSSSRLGSISTADGTVQWLQHGLRKQPELQPQTATDAAENAAVSATTTTTTATGATTTTTSTTTTGEQAQIEVSAQTTEKVETKALPEREVQIQTIVWSEDGTAAILPLRAADNKDWWLMAFDPATASARVLFHGHDDAWVQWFSPASIGFVPGSRTAWFLSEHTGWMHLYTVDFTGGQPRALTSGNWEVDEVVVAEDRKHFHLIATRESLHEKHLYRLPVTGGTMTRLTTQPGWHDAVVSPDGKTIADVYSYKNKPAELYVGTVRVTTSHAPEFATYPWLDAPIVHVPAKDGKQVPAHIYKPANWNGGPAVIFVHGAGYLQNVHRGWSNYFREYMFHHLLMERGYLVLDLDYRASAGYGRDWRTAIYRHMGGVDLNDHVDAAKWLVSEHGVDAKRIGIYGGSYGGFIALMAMFTTPDVFAAGAALRPVTDWAHYNDPYTANILNTPQTDPEAYRRSSPIYFAEGLKGALLICHGMIDVNVHYQDSVRLAQRLIELRKENWELAGYPLEDHSFVEPTSWADEYKRILKLFETNLK